VIDEPEPPPADPPLDESLLLPQAAAANIRAPAAAKTYGLRVRTVSFSSLIPDGTAPPSQAARVEVIDQ
jgi:hypothetical protein